MKKLTDIQIKEAADYYADSFRLKIQAGGWHKEIMDHYIAGITSDTAKRYHDCDPVEFAHWIVTRPGISESVKPGLWRIIDENNIEKHVTSKELYQLFKSNNNGNTKRNA